VDDEMLDQTPDPRPQATAAAAVATNGGAVELKPYSQHFAKRSATSTARDAEAPS
jgi:hypothetical protein